MHSAKKNSNTPEILASGPLSDVTGAILAGGSGKRLGYVHKGLIEVDGKPLIERTVNHLQALFHQNLIVTNQAPLFQDLGVPLVEDSHIGKGAPGGLHAALTNSRTPWTFLVACDMPNIVPAVIRHMASQLQKAEIVYCAPEGRPEPLFAFYNKSVLEHLDDLLTHGNPSFMDLFAESRTHSIPASSWSHLPDRRSPFKNINTPQDLISAKGTIPERAKKVP